MSNFGFTRHATERWQQRYPHDDAADQASRAVRIGRSAVKRLVPSGKKDRQCQYYRCPNGAVLVTDKRDDSVITVLPHYEAEAHHHNMAAAKRRNRT